MPRVRLRDLGRYEFSHSVTLQPRDINYGGHLANDALVSVVGAARAHVFRTLGVSELNLGDGRTGIVMSDLVVNYKSEAFMFDEITVETYIGELSHTGFRMFHRVVRGDTLVALVETGMTAFNYVSKKIVLLPEQFLKALTAVKS
jgi:acyl-CoA thioesterase FadM